MTRARSTRAFTDLELTGTGGGLGVTGAAFASALTGAAAAAGLTAAPGLAATAALPPAALPAATGAFAGAVFAVAALTGAVLLVTAGLATAGLDTAGLAAVVDVFAGAAALAVEMSLEMPGLAAGVFDGGAALAAANAWFADLRVCTAMLWPWSGCRRGFMGLG
jgi:hypothetical protein